MRNYAILLKDFDKDVFLNIAWQIRNYDAFATVHIFAKNFYENKKMSDDFPEWIKIEDIPEDIYEKDSKIYNFIVKWFKDNNYTGFLHVFNDSLIINPEKMGIFVKEIEEFMKIFEYDVWLNTFTDECNFIFDKWISRVNVVIDNDNLKKIYGKTIKWTSNANTNFMVYDLDTLKIENVLFDETFSIAMFYIIKFFAERRNKGLPGSYMNFYPTLESEKDIFKKTIQPQSVRNKNAQEQKTMIEEDKLFRDMNIDFHPTDQLEPMMEFIKTKIEKYGEMKNV